MSITLPVVMATAAGACRSHGRPLAPAQPARRRAVAPGERLRELAELARIVIDSDKQPGPGAGGVRALGVEDALLQPGCARPSTRSWRRAGEDPESVRR
jgi:hypothetical protein